MHEELKSRVCEANKELSKRGLVIYSWGNVSGIDRETNTVAIKPSGVSYDELTPDDIVLLDIEGNVVEGSLKPSSDTPTHLELYRNFESIGGICHAHCRAATAWAQACSEIPCFGTTHADQFYGPVPVTQLLTEDQIRNDYELNTGRIIARTFASIDPLAVPAVLVAGHGPFSWGQTAAKAVETMVVLEEVAQMALQTITIKADQEAIGRFLLDKHYLRKHGKDAYYGQNRNS